jgi:O-antigen ligase
MMQLLAEGGVLGFAGGFFFLGSSFFLLLRLFRKNFSEVTGSFAMGAAGVLVYVIIHGSFDFILRLSANVFLLAVIIGLGLSLSPARPRAACGDVSRVP